MTGIKLIGTGMYIPETVATNEDFTKIVDTSDEWITKRTGIKERHPSNGEPTWYMGVQAAKQAMEDAGVTPDEIDMVISTSVTGGITIRLLLRISCRENWEFTRRLALILTVRVQGLFMALTWHSDILPWMTM